MNGAPLSSYDFNDFGAAGGSPNLAYAPTSYGSMPFQQQQPPSLNNQQSFGFGLSRASDVNWRTGASSNTAPWQFGAGSYGVGGVGGGGGGYNFGAPSTGHDPSAGLLRNMWNSSREYWHTGVSQNVKKFIYLFLMLLVVIAVGKLAHFIYRWRYPAGKRDDENAKEEQGEGEEAKRRREMSQEGGGGGGGGSTSQQTSNQTIPITPTPVYDHAHAFDYALSPPAQSHLSIMPAHYRHLKPRHLTSHLNAVTSQPNDATATSLLETPDPADRVSVRKFIVESIEMTAVLVQWANEPLAAIQQLSAAASAHASSSPSSTPSMKLKQTREATNKQKLWELRQLYLSRALQLLQILQQYIDPTRLQTLYQVNISQYIAQITQDQNACQDAIRQIQTELEQIARDNNAHRVATDNTTITPLKQTASINNTANRIAAPSQASSYRQQSLAHTNTPHNKNVDPPSL